MRPMVVLPLGGKGVLPTEEPLDIAPATKPGHAVSLSQLAATVGSYAEIKAMRDAGNLIPGNIYEINDFITIYKQAATADVRSDASNLFNIRLLAIGPDRFAPEAWAAPADRTQPEGAEITASTPLDQWRLLYDLDNDASLYDWAAATGKGVIYRLRDHLGNDSPFDHYNIKFRRFEITATTTAAAALVGKFAAPKTAASGFTINSTNHEDYLAFNFANDVRDNKIERCATGTKASLPNVVIRGYAAGMRLGPGSRNITILGNCSQLVTGGNCRDFIVAGNCLNNCVGEEFSLGYFGGNVTWNSIGNNCFNIVCNGGFTGNAILNYCYNMSVTLYCNNNRIGNYCHDISASGYIHSVTTGNYCSDIVFGWVYGCVVGEWCIGLVFTGTLRRVAIESVVQNKDFSTSDIYNKAYNQTIQINAAGTAVSRWINSSNVEQILALA